MGNRKLTVIPDRWISLLFSPLGTFRDRPMDKRPPIEDFEALADRFKILSEPSRLQILATICRRECNVKEICRLTGLNQANVSKHLQLLRSAGVVACRRVGVCRYYRIIDSDLLGLCAKSLFEGEKGCAD